MINGNNTPPVVVDFSAIESELDSVSANFEIARTEPPEKINTMAETFGQTIAFNLDFKIVKDGVPQSTYEFDDVIMVKFPIPDEAKGRFITIYRLHNGMASVLPNGAENAIDGEYFEISEDFITLYIKKFSDYALGYSELTQTITASAENGGTISPSGDVIVDTGTSQTFTITADSGWYISDVKVDGVSVGNIETYTFDSIMIGHTISATFSYIYNNNLILPSKPVPEDPGNESSPNKKPGDKPSVNEDIAVQDNDESNDFTDDTAQGDDFTDDTAQGDDFTDDTAQDINKTDDKNGNPNTGVNNPFALFIVIGSGLTVFASKFKLKKNR